MCRISGKQSFLGSKKTPHLVFITNNIPEEGCDLVGHQIVCSLGTPSGGYTSAPTTLHRLKTVRECEHGVYICTVSTTDAAVEDLTYLVLLGSACLLAFADNAFPA